MRFIISERQLGLLLEQKKVDYMTGPGSFYGTYGYDDEGETIWTKLDHHTKNTILALAASFIPYVGPLISTGIALYDAKQYYDEGDTETAAMVAIFSMIPAIGLAGKLGLGKWTAKALSEIGKKISLGSKLKSVEVEVIKRVAKYKELIKKEFELFKKNNLNPVKEKVGKNIAQDFFEGGFESFKQQMKSKYPMSLEEAREYLKTYYKTTGKDPIREYNKLKLNFPQGDEVWVATALKNNIKPPVGKYLYHGTSTSNLKNISSRGLDNSLGQTANVGSMSSNLGKGVTTATGDIDAATIFARSTAKSTKGKELIVRFPNVNKHELTFFNKHEAINPKMLEYSLDGGSTWTKVVK